LKANTVGDLLADNILCWQTAISGTTPIPLDVRDLSNLDGACLQLINDTGSTVTGTWKIEASNNWSSLTVPNLNQNATRFPTKWTDITAGFKTLGGSAITNPSGSALSQMVQCYPLVAGAIRVTFTPASGAGTITVLYRAKGNR